MANLLFLAAQTLPARDIARTQTKKSLLERKPRRVTTERENPLENKFAASIFRKIL
jgi:hypothetical protein